MLFGSSKTDLSLADSDIDITFITDVDYDDSYANDVLDEIDALVLCHRSLNATITQRIKGMRVPLIKCTIRDIKCDIVVNNMVAVHNSRLIFAYTRIDPRIRHLIMLVKLWCECLLSKSC